MDLIKSLEKNVLDHGVVRLIDSMPVIDTTLCSFESAVVQMARVSYGTGTKSFREDIGLTRYLLENDHTSPFEGVTLKFYLKMPIFVARQWVRHRTASQNEISARYSVLKDVFYIPERERLTRQSLENKQGSSSDLIEDADMVVKSITEHSESSYALYQSMLDKGLSRELSRMVLPVNIYTEMYWVMNLHNLLKFLKLRIDSHAQYEIRVFANAIYEILETVAPNIMKIWKSSSAESIKLTSEEVEVFNKFVKMNDIDIKGFCPEGWSARRIESFVKKIERLT